MRSCVVVIVTLLGLSITAFILVALKGGNDMSMQYDDTEASTALPLMDTRLSGASETATFALG
jgi:hypothetical protein